MVIFHICGYAAENRETNENLNVVLVSSNIRNAEAIAGAARQDAVTVVYDFERTNLFEIYLTLIELTDWDLEVKTGSSNLSTPINFSQLIKTPIYF